MYSVEFWKQAGERAAKGFIVAFLGAAALGSTGPVNAFHINWAECAGVGLGGVLASLLLSFASLPFGEPNSPSAVRLKPPAAANPEPEEPVDTGQPLPGLHRAQKRPYP